MNDLNLYDNDESKNVNLPTSFSVPFIFDAKSVTFTKKKEKKEKKIAHHFSLQNPHSMSSKFNEINKFCRQS